jgi:hypothetical protein
MSSQTLLTLLGSLASSSRLSLRRAFLVGGHTVTTQITRWDTILLYGLKPYDHSLIMGNNQVNTIAIHMNTPLDKLIYIE